MSFLGQHILARIGEDVPPEGHFEPAFGGPQTDPLGTFSYMAESRCIQIEDFYVLFGELLLRYEYSRCPITPQVTRLLISVVAISTVMFRSDDNRPVCLICCEIAFDDFYRIQKRRARGRDGNDPGFRDTEEALYGMGQRACRVVGV